MRPTAVRAGETGVGKQNETNSVKRNKGATLEWRATLQGCRQDGVAGGGRNASESGSLALILPNVHFHHINNFQPSEIIWAVFFVTVLSSPSLPFIFLLPLRPCSCGEKSSALLRLHKSDAPPPLLSSLTERTAFRSVAATGVNHGRPSILHTHE